MIQHSSSNFKGHLCADFLADGGIREAVSGHEIDTHEVNARVKNDPGLLCFVYLMTMEMTTAVTVDVKEKV
jgi:hypothetical protein